MMFIVGNVVVAISLVVIWYIMQSNALTIPTINFSVKTHETSCLEQAHYV